MSKQPLKAMFLKTQAADAEPRTIRYIRRFFEGPDSSATAAGVATRVGLMASGLMLFGSGFWVLLSFPSPVMLGSIGLFALGSATWIYCRRGQMSTIRANFFALFGHLCALLVSYLLATRFVNVVYSTDSIIATYMAVRKVIELQNPYLFSIQPFLAHFGLPPSYYTPHVDGSYEFHLNYPALNFLPLVPFYLLGLHDLRDIVLVFHVLCILVVFGSMPGRLKALSVVPFAIYFPWAVAGSSTDSVWALMLVLGSVFWYRNRRASFLSVGFAMASKQLAILVLPFLILRNWRESSAARSEQLRMAASFTGLSALGFLLPNLPFILLSPVDWWTGVVAPYLPGSTPLITMGIGFSELAATLGFNPPYSVFLLMMGLAFTGSIYAYSRWFAKMSGFVWILPALVLFFYHRSLANYLFYWIIPLLAELSRSNIKLSTFKSRIGFVPKINYRLQTPRFLNHGVSYVLLGIIVTAAFVGVSGAYVSRNAKYYPVSLRIDDIRDPDQLGVATLVRLTLTNGDTEPVIPRFFVKWYPQPYMWLSLNGTRTIAANSTVQLTIASPDSVGGIPNHAQFRVWVFNSENGAPAGQSTLSTVELPEPTVANPRFRWWTLDMSVGVKTPFGWKLERSNVDAEYSGITSIDDFLTSGLRMRLNASSTDNNFRQSSISIGQKIMANVTVAELTLQKDFTDASTNTALFGAMLTDGGHTVYIIFSDATSQERILTYAENTTIVMPLSNSQSGSVRIEVQRIWTSQDWETPRQLNLALFLKASATGLYDAEISSVRAWTSTSETYLSSA